jgi:hypothetical protein
MPKAVGISPKARKIRRAVLTDSPLWRHTARTPMRRSLRLALQRASDHRLDPLILRRARRAGSGLVSQILDILRQEAAALFADCLRVDVPDRR